MGNSTNGGNPYRSPAADTPSVLSASNYIDGVPAVFGGRGYSVNQDVEFDTDLFRFVATRTRRTILVIVPMFYEEFFLFAEFDRLDLDTFVHFNFSCADYAQHCRAMRSKCEQLVTNVSLELFVYAIAVAPKIESGVLDHIRTQKPRVSAWPTISAVFDTSARQLNYFERIPWLGNAIYRSIRNTIVKELVPV